MKPKEIQELKDQNQKIIETHRKMFSQLDHPITGCFTSEDVFLLKDIIDKTQSKNILEIGFNIGSSCLGWLLSSPDTCVTAIDIHYPLKSIEFIKNEFPGRFAFNNMDSKDLVYDDVKNQLQNQFDLILIDGDHSYEAVVRDLENSLMLNPKYILFDDVRHPAHLYIEDIIDNHPKLEVIEFYEYGGCLSLVKVKYN